MMDGEILCYLKKEKNALNTLIPSWLLFGAVAVLSPSLSVSLSLVASLQVSWDKPPRKTFYWYFFFFYHFPPVFSMSPCFAESLLLLLLLLPFFFPFEETFRSVLYDAPIQCLSCLSSFVILFWAIHKLCSMPLPVPSPSFCVLCCTVTKGITLHVKSFELDWAIYLWCFW